MRRYDDPVDVHRGWVSEPGGGTEAPEQFRWRGRRWRVQAVVGHWVETGAWWQQQRSGPVDLLPERELWRVAAGSDRDVDGTGVFDLALDSGDGCWRLVGCLD